MDQEYIVIINTLGKDTPTYARPMYRHITVWVVWIDAYVLQLTNKISNSSKHNLSCIMSYLCPTSLSPLILVL